MPKRKLLFRMAVAFTMSHNIRPKMCEVTYFSRETTCKSFLHGLKSGNIGDVLKHGFREF